MKRVVVILEGAGEDSGEGAPADSPLSAARTPALDSLARHARLGTAQMVPNDLPTGAELSLASTLGVDPVRFPIGRGPAEAIAHGVELGHRDTAFRANLVNIKDGLLLDHSPEPLRLAEIRGFLHTINEDAPAGAEVLCGDGHRCVAVFRDSVAFRKVRAVDPLQVLGKPIRDHLPQGRGSRALAIWTKNAVARLHEHELNAVRADLNEPTITGVWFWGGGEIPRVASFRERFGVGGELISATALLQGIGRVLRLEVEAWEPRLRDRREELKRLASRTLAALDRRDFVCVHADWPDGAGHRGDRAAKVEAIETCDAELIQPIAARLALEPAWRLLITTAHSTPTGSRVQSTAPAQILIAGPGIDSNRGDAFDEASAAAGEIRLERGHDLLEYFIARA